MKRITKETVIDVEMNTKQTDISIKDVELNHMMKTLFFYMKKNVLIEAKYDLRHHLWEDMGITLGSEIREKYDIGSIQRFGTTVIPMDDALVLVSLDFSRCYVCCDMECEFTESGFEISLLKEFLWGLARSAGITIHVRKINGENPHHVIEAAFKALGSSLDKALKPSKDVFSTKGMI